MAEYLDGSRFQISHSFPAPIPPPILYQNVDNTITLIDIPASIAQAQGLGRCLLSTKALEEPFPSTEPKTPQAREKVLARLGATNDESEYVEDIEKALETICKARHGAWAHPRLLIDQILAKDISKPEDVLRRIDEAMSKLFQSIIEAKRPFLGVRTEPQALPSLQESMEADLKRLGMEDWASETREHYANLVQSPSNSSQYSDDELEDPEVFSNWDGSYCNYTNAPVKLLIPSTHLVTKAKDMCPIPQEYIFAIPPHSSFLLSSCTQTPSFRAHILSTYPRPSFDFILLDPPWSNKSARRRGAYDSSSPKAITKLVAGMDLTRYIPPSGLVGIWVTNNTSVRETALQIFENLNVGLVEEWVWIKTTTKGEPVYSVDGVWRKPYEVLLLARAPVSRLEVAQPAETVVRRVIAGVPDFHSRKPCLKMLIEPFLPREYRALEVFARYLVEGWTAWGDEVLKYNWEGYHESET